MITNECCRKTKTKTYLFLFVVLEDYDVDINIKSKVNQNKNHVCICIYPDDEINMIIQTCLSLVNTQMQHQASLHAC